MRSVRQQTDYLPGICGLAIDEKVDPCLSQYYLFDEIVHGAL